MRYPLELRLESSRSAVTLIAAIHLVAAIAFVCSSLSWSIVAPAVAALAASLNTSLLRERRKTGLRVLLENGGTLKVESGGRAESAVPEAGCTDFGWAVWLQWRHSNAAGGGALMLLRDNLGEDAWRALRTWLRHKAFATPEGRDGGAET